MIYSDIQTALARAGITVFDPAAKQDICRQPYAVVQNMGSYRYAQSHRLGYTLLSVHCYVPLNHYDELDDLMVRVKTALAALAPDLRPVGNEGIHTINDRFKAHESYVQYLVQKYRV